MSREQTDVAVIGAGIIGSGVASALSRQGMSVVLLDPAPGLGSSLGNAGLVVPSYATPMSNPQNLWAGIRGFGSDSAPVTFARPLGLETMKWMARFAMDCRPARVKRDTTLLHGLATRSLERYVELRDEGLDLGVKEQGWLWLSTGEGNRASLQASAGRMAEAGAACEVVDRAVAAELQPGLGEGVTAGIWFPHEAFLDPAEATHRWLLDATEHGAEVIREQVIGAERDGNSLKSVHTPTRTVTAKQFVLATGASSREVGKLLGVHIPIESGYGWSVTLNDPDGTVSRALMGIENHVVISPLPGRVRITGGMRFGGLGGIQPRDSDIRDLRDNAQTVVPALTGLEEESRWQGARPMTASGVPIIKRIGQGNLIVAAGHGPLGITLAPTTVDSTVELVQQGVKTSLSR